jgi:pyrroloquinoline quinone biosynthesis protein B
VASAALVDPDSDSWILIDPSPDLPAQLLGLGKVLGRDGPPPLRDLRVFLTHIHLGHYWGLGFLGREGAAASGVEVFAGEKACAFLRENHPFRRMVEEGRIEPVPLGDGRPWRGAAEILPMDVPHRLDFSETFAFRIQGPRASVFYMPDADRIPDRLLAAVGGVDHAFVDGTFYSPDEIPGLSDGTVPHPPVRETAQKFAAEGTLGNTRVVFTHLNHTNPLLDPDGPERADLGSLGFFVAEDFEVVEI